MIGIRKLYNSVVLGAVAKLIEIHNSTYPVRRWRTRHAHIIIVPSRAYQFLASWLAHYFIVSS